MRISNFAAVGVSLGVAAFLAAAAAPASAAFDKTELGCRKAIAKGYAKALATADKTSAGCHKSRNGGKIGAGIDCNDLGPEPGTPGAADTKQKFAKAQQKLIDTPAKKCAGIDETLPDFFISCPEPCGTDLGIANPLTTMGEVAQCLACVAGTEIETRNTTILGAPDPLMMSKDDVKCAGAIAKGHGKYLSTIMKTRTKCQDTADNDGGMALDATCATDPDPDGKGKIAKAGAKADGGIDKSCAAADLNNVGSCAVTNLTDLKACANASTDAADATGFPAAYETDATICPTGVRSLILAGNGINGPSPSFLDVGWKGFSHNLDVPDNYTITVDVTCPSSTPPCGNCTIDGLRVDADPASDYQLLTRCSNDFSKTCDTPFAPDAINCGGSNCVYILGPPLPISAAGNPVCSVNTMAADVTGTGNIETGEAELLLDLSTRVHTGGSSSLTKPCPTCEGDDILGDGVQNGLCNGGARDGDPCDVLGYDETFAKFSEGSGLSLDCVPFAAENISGTGLQIELPLTTGTSSLAAETPCDSPLGAFDCFCALCSGDTSIPCRNDADCIAVAAGTCTSNSAVGINRQPNDCGGGFTNCVDIGDEKGECSDVSETYCEGISKANGFGFLTCLNNAECVNPSFEECASNDCGPCTVVQQRPCFLDPIESVGTPDPDNPVLAGTFCLPPTTNLSINGSSGSPGPGRVRIQQQATRLYD